MEFDRSRLNTRGSRLSRRRRYRAENDTVPVPSRNMGTPAHAIGTGAPESLDRARKYGTTDRSRTQASAGSQRPSHDISDSLPKKTKSNNGIKDVLEVIRSRSCVFEFELGVSFFIYLLITILRPLFTDVTSFIVAFPLFAVGVHLGCKKFGLTGVPAFRYAAINSVCFMLMFTFKEYGIIMLVFLILLIRTNNSNTQFYRYIWAGCFEKAIDHASNYLLLDLKVEHFLQSLPQKYSQEVMLDILQEPTLPLDKILKAFGSVDRFVQVFPCDNGSFVESFVKDFAECQPQLAYKLCSKCSKKFPHKAIEILVDYIGVVEAEKCAESIHRVDLLAKILFDKGNFSLSIDKYISSQDASDYKKVIKQGLENVDNRREMLRYLRHLHPFIGWNTLVTSFGNRDSFIHFLGNCACDFDFDEIQWAFEWDLRKNESPFPLATAICDVFDKHLEALTILVNHRDRTEAERYAERTKDGHSLLAKVLLHDHATFSCGVEKYISLEDGSNFAMVIEKGLLDPHNEGCLVRYLVYFSDTHLDEMVVQLGNFKAPITRKFILKLPTCKGLRVVEMLIEHGNINNAYKLFVGACLDAILENLSQDASEQRIHNDLEQLILKLENKGQRELAKDRKMYEMKMKPTLLEIEKRSSAVVAAGFHTKLNDFITYLHEHHGPAHGARVSATPKETIKRAFMVYHPDRNTREPEERQLICHCVSKCLNDIKQRIPM